MATEYKAVGKLYPIWSFKMVYPLLDSSGLYRTNTWRVVKILTDDAPKTCHVHLRLALFTAVTACQPLAVGSTVPTVPELLSITPCHTQPLGPLRLLLTKNSIKGIIMSSWNNILTFSNTRYSRNCMQLCLARIKRVCPKKNSQKKSHEPSLYTGKSVFNLVGVGWGGVGIMKS